MKLFSLLLAAAVGVAAQNIHIGSPSPATNVARGQNITVEVDKPNSLSGSTDVAIVIALRSCAALPDGSCDSVNNNPPEILGSVLYTGPFAPKYSTIPGEGWKPPYQNFTVYLPPTFQQGNADLTVTHFVLIGAGPYPILDIANTTVHVV